MRLETECVLLSVQVGKPRTVGEPGAKDPMDREWTTGIFKSPVDTPVWLGRLNLLGDGQADLTVHGGVDKAVLAYSADHYPLWRQELRLPEFPYGAFGENFTIAGLNERVVSIGELFEVGGAIVQVSQPRQPCWKLARRWKIKDLPARVVENGRSGWYFRVLKESYVSAGTHLILQDRPYPEWTIFRVNEILHNVKDHVHEAAELSNCPLLAEGLRRYFAARGHGGTIETGSTQSSDERL